MPLSFATILGGMITLIGTPPNIVVSDALREQRWIPELRFVTQYHDEPGYIAALAASVREFWVNKGRGDHLVMSFHGVPRRYLLAGDPYHCQCQKTGRMLADTLGLNSDEWSLSFQSRVGREEWLRPTPTSP